MGSRSVRPMSQHDHVAVSSDPTWRDSCSASTRISRSTLASTDHRCTPGTDSALAGGDRKRNDGHVLEMTSSAHDTWATHAKSPGFKGHQNVRLASAMVGLDILPMTTDDSTTPPVEPSVDLAHGHRQPFMQAASPTNRVASRVPASHTVKKMRIAILLCLQQRSSESTPLQVILPAQAKACSPSVSKSRRIPSPGAGRVQKASKTLDSGFRRNDGTLFTRSS